MTATSASDIESYLRYYRAQIVWGSLVVLGLALPILGLLLQKSGEGYEIHNLFVGVYLLVAWFLLTIIVVFFGTPFRWALSIGIAPAVSDTISGLLHTASNYAMAEHNFWLLILTGNGQALQALLLEVSFIFLVGFPPALIAYVIGCITAQYLDPNQDERISRMLSIMLITLAFLSMYIGWYIGKNTSPNVLSP